MRFRRVGRRGVSRSFKIYAYRTEKQKETSCSAKSDLEREGEAAIVLSPIRPSRLKAI
jgi:hypothetical protein